MIYWHNTDIMAVVVLATAFIAVLAHTIISREKEKEDDDVEILACGCIFIPNTTLVHRVDYCQKCIKCCTCERLAKGIYLQGGIKYD